MEFIKELTAYTIGLVVFILIWMFIGWIAESVLDVTAYPWIMFFGAVAFMIGHPIGKFVERTIIKGWVKVD